LVLVLERWFLLYQDMGTAKFDRIVVKVMIVFHTYAIQCILLG